MGANWYSCSADYRENNWLKSDGLMTSVYATRYFSKDFLLIPTHAT